MNKRCFYTELAYAIGLLILSLGTALMERADFGVSMVVAPAYILHLKLSQHLPFFSFGMAEYTLQAALLLLTMLIVRRAKLSYLFSLVTAVIYGLLLDGAMALLALLPDGYLALNAGLYVVGMLLCSAGISLLFHTYISPEAYEMFVREVSQHFHLDIHKFKTAYDCASCLISILMSFIFFGLWHFEGIKFGTVLCALLNGFLISQFTKLFERKFEFKDRFSLKKYF